MNRSWYFYWVMLSVLISPTLGAINLPKVRKAVFKISVVSSSYDPERPWVGTPISGGVGTGFYIGKGLILTNAHVVRNAKQITVLQDGQSKPLTAYVHFIAHDADLALLTVPNPKDLSQVPALEFGGVPKVQSSIHTVGYPMGGEQISITKGIISRVGYRRYVHNQYASHLLIQVDSAINPGNSGGPVFQEDKVIGVAFQAFRSAENTGYVIPVPVIKRFLVDIKDGIYDGHPYVGMLTHRGKFNSPGFRAYVSAPADLQGTVVDFVAPYSTFSGHLQKNDVLTSIDHRPIGDDGKIVLYGERIDFYVIYDLKQFEETISFEIIREGQRKSIEFAITKKTPPPIGPLRFERNPPYYSVNGLIFIGLSQNYLQKWGQDWLKQIPLNLRYTYTQGLFDRELKTMSDYVVLADKLPLPTNSDLTPPFQQVVNRVNHKLIRGFASFVDAIENSTGPMVRIDFFGDEEPIILTKYELIQAAKRVNSTFGISELKSISAPVDGSIAKEDLQ